MLVKILNALILGSLLIGFSLSNTKNFNSIKGNPTTKNQNKATTKAMPGQAIYKVFIPVGNGSDWLCAFDCPAGLCCEITGTVIRDKNAHLEAQSD